MDYSIKKRKHDDARLKIVLGRNKEYRDEKNVKDNLDSNIKIKERESFGVVSSNVQEKDSFEKKVIKLSKKIILVCNIKSSKLY